MTLSERDRLAMLRQVEAKQMTLVTVEERLGLRCRQVKHLCKRYPAFFIGIDEGRSMTAARDGDRVAGVRSRREDKRRVVGGLRLRVGQPARARLAEGAVARPAGPVAGELDHDAAGGLRDGGGDLDQPRPLGQGVGVAEFVGHEFVVAQRGEEVVRRGVQQQPPEVGEEAVATQAVGMEVVLQFVDPLLRLAALNIGFVDPQGVVVVFDR